MHGNYWWRISSPITTFFPPGSEFSYPCSAVCPRAGPESGRFVTGLRFRAAGALSRRLAARGKHRDGDAQRRNADLKAKASPAHNRGERLTERMLYPEKYLSTLRVAVRVISISRTWL